MVNKDKVKKIIDNWDPIGLMSHSPDDEYIREEENIYELLSYCKSSEQLAKGIQNVFTKAFGSIFDKTYEDCVKVANKILEE